MTNQTTTTTTSKARKGRTVAERLADTATRAALQAGQDAPVVTPQAAPEPAPQAAPVMNARADGAYTLTLAGTYTPAGDTVARTRATLWLQPVKGGYNCAVLLDCAPFRKDARLRAQGPRAVSLAQAQAWAMAQAAALPGGPWTVTTGRVAGARADAFTAASLPTA